MTPKRNQLKNRNDIKALKLRYKQHISLLTELFPTWSREDLLFAMDECQGDFDLTVNRISEGHASQWQVKKQKKTKFTEKPVRAPKKAQTKTINQKNTEAESNKPSWASILKGPEKEELNKEATQTATQVSQCKEATKAVEEPIQEVKGKCNKGLILEPIQSEASNTGPNYAEEPESTSIQPLEKNATQDTEQESIQEIEEDFTKDNIQSRVETSISELPQDHTQKILEETLTLVEITTNTVPEEVNEESTKNEELVEEQGKIAKVIETPEKIESAEKEPIKSEEKESRKHSAPVTKQQIHRVARRLNQTEAVVLPTNQSAPNTSLNVQFGSLSLSNEDEEGEEKEDKNKDKEIVPNTPFHSTPQPTSYREPVNDSEPNSILRGGVVNAEHSQPNYVPPVIYGHPVQPNQPDSYINPYYVPHPTGYTGVEYNSYDTQRMAYYDPYGQPLSTPANHLCREKFTNVPHHPPHSVSLHRYHPHPHPYIHPPLPQQHVVVAENSAPSPLSAPQYNGQPYFYQYYYPHLSYQNNDYYKYPVYGGGAGVGVGKAYEYPSYEEYRDAAHYDHKYNPTNHNEMMYKDQPNAGQQSQSTTNGNYYLPSHQNYPPYIRHPY
ncbi:hypothetical protein BY458DRAFT_490807 [Sporodiniella umbellata]|nr:hypothetical protein BY458DRAFT_490807 [Sporodiniella umbellata]